MFIEYVARNIKDARSVSLYTYNWSQLQYIKYTIVNNLTLKQKLPNCVTNNVFL